MALSGPPARPSLQIAIHKGKDPVTVVGPDELLEALLGALEALGVGFEIKRPGQVPDYQSPFLKKVCDNGAQGACFERYLGKPARCHPCLLARAISSGEIQRGTLNALDGRRFDVTALPNFGNGKAQGWAMEVLQDVTERTRAEQAMRESEERFRALTENTPDVISRFDRERRHLYINPVVAKYTGIPADRYLGKTIDEVGVPKDVCRLMNSAIDAVFETGETRRVQFQWPSGAWLDWQLVAERDEVGQTRAVITSGRNITTLKRAEEELRQREAALRKSEEKYRMITENAVDGIWLVDVLTMRIVYASPAVVENSGYSQEELANMHLEQLLTPESGAYVRDILHEILGSAHTTTGVTRRLEVEELTKGGATRWVEVTARLLFDECGKPHEIIGLTHDITERKRAHDLLTQAKVHAESVSRMKSQFVSNVSHEIRTPLNAIIGFTELILRDTELASAQARAAILLQESELLLSIVNDLLDHAKVEEGKFELVPEPILLSDVLDAVGRSASANATRKGLKFQLIVAANAPQFIVCDELRLRQVLQNLVGNAIKFTERGYVKLEVDCCSRTAHKAELLFSVTDTGIGIAEDRLESIFDAFVQADANTTRRYGGSGLGTTIARQLVRMMGGELCVTSKLGIGSRFYFNVSFETVSGDGDECPPTVDSEHIGLSEVELAGSILIAEDYPVNHVILREHLESAGHKVTLAANGLDAVNACARERFDLVFMDLQMPVMDGFEATRRIRRLPEANGRVPILAVTASAEPRTRRECVASGMNGVVVKPIRRQNVLETVDKWLRHSAGEIETPIPPSMVTYFHRSEPPKQELVFDYRLLVEQFGGKESLARSIARQFSDKLEKDVGELNSLFDAADWEQLARNAHRLKGGASTIGAFGIADLARKLEVSAKGNDVNVTSTLLQELQQAHRSLLSVISAVCQGSEAK